MENRVNRDLRKLYIGMRRRFGVKRIFIQTEKGEFLYPAIIERQKPGWQMWLPLIPLMAVLLFIAFSLLKSKGAVQKQVSGTAITVGSEKTKNDAEQMTRLVGYLATDQFRQFENSLVRDSFPLDRQDSYGWTLLHWAAMCGNDAAYQYLIDRGADTQIRTKKRWFRFAAGATAMEIKKNSKKY